MGEVVDFAGPFYGEIPADTVLSGAIGQGLETVMVIGWLPDGTLYATSSTGHVPDNVYLLAKAQHAFLTDE